MNTNKLKLFLRKISKFLISLFVKILEKKPIMNIFSRKLFCLPLCQLLEVQISVHENSHFPFPEESKKKHEKVRCWSVFLDGKVLYFCCCSLMCFTVIRYISFWNWFTIYFMSVCHKGIKGIKLHLQISTLRFAVELTDTLYFEIKTKL